MIRGVLVSVALASGAAWSGPPRRIVSISPAVTEMLFTIGAGDRVVGVTDHCTYPPAALSLEKVGGSMTPSLEKIVALKPDLVVGDATTTVSPDRIRTMERAGLHVEMMKMRSIADILEGMNLLGARCGVPAAAKAEAVRLNHRLSAVKQAVRQRKRPKVLVVVWAEPLWTVGRGSHIHHAIEAAGGENAAGDIGKANTTFSLEEAVKRDPDVMVLAFHQASPRDLPGIWKRLRAIREGRCLVMDPDEMVRAGPRLVKSIEALARALHPDAFRP